MSKRVLDVGNCSLDHGNMSGMLEKVFAVIVVQTHGLEDTLAALQGSSFDLVLVNRKLDQDYSDGLEIIHQIKADPKLAELPIMLITNYAEYQDQAVSAGCQRGFGKKELYTPETHEKLSPFLR